MPDSLSIEPHHVGSMVSDSAAHHRVVEHLTFEEPDSVLGSYFIGSPSPLSIHEVHIEVPLGEFPLPKDSTFLAQFRQLWNPQIRDIVWQHEEVPWRPNGIAGSPADYQFRNDDYVTSVLLIGFFLIAWVIAGSWKYIRTQMKDFFITRERNSLFTERKDTVLRGRFFLIVQTCFMIALLYYSYVQKFQIEVFTQVSPYLILGATTAIALIYYGTKIILYNIVNHTFFSQIRCKMWMDNYLISVLVTGCALLPVTLLVVFSNLGFDEVSLLCILLLSVIKILLLFKCYRIFFSSLLDSLHIFLYFCALEIIPLGLLGAILLITSNILTTI